ncbi:secreted phosphoprotein 24 [Mugil cephalus]|uniref:secreted phosphoprotein 24 n=1 Tax=Mugil cephalus TaxID=48193 RepID=UPI001FB849E9|nr:secreted phosphoprotein 24 [Mugil cephalus]
MRSCVLLLALLQSLGCTGAPLRNYELQSMADKGLGAAVAEVNSVYAVDHLYRVTRASVTKVIPRGLDTVDLMMPFGIKETECAKASGKDPQTCAFRPGFFVPSLSCSTWVRISSTSTQVVSLRCGHDSSSSSSESSEEVFSRRRQEYVPFASRDPAPNAAPVQPGRFFQNRAVDVQPRGDTFSNFMV